VALRDFIRRIGLLTRRDQRLEPGAQTAHRQPGEATVAMGSAAAAHVAKASAEPAARRPAESASEELTVAAPNAPAQRFEASRTPAMAEVAPPRGGPRTDSPPASWHPEAGGGVDPLAATRVVGAAGEKPLGQVLGVLVAVEGELEGAIHPVRSGSNRLGRHPECEVFLPSEWISRQHARIEYQGGIFAIEASSDKPTLVNSERIVGNELRDGDYIKLGKTTLRFRSIL